MSLNLSKRSSLGFIRAFLGVGLFLQVITSGSHLVAQGSLSKLQAHNLEYSLEGKQFVGPFGAEGVTDPEEDIFTFKDGKFAARNCIKWGFSMTGYNTIL